MHNSLWKEIEAILPAVQKPARYINREWNSIHKPHDKVKVKVALAYPDTYEVGQSNLGLQILYDILNARPDVVAERVYAPWLDMEEQLRKKEIPLFALESCTPLKSFDIIGFSLQTEMTYTNVLNMLNLAGIPIYASERNDEYPVIIAGGPCVFNPEPLAPFFDIFAVGEGEEVILEIVKKYEKSRKSHVARPANGGAGRKELLRKLAQIEGVYVPEFYEVSYERNGTIKEIKPTFEDVPEKVTKRKVENLDKARFPTQPIVPFIDTVHNRCTIEIMRGCVRGCRFCQAGVIYRPRRERSVDTVLGLAEKTLNNTGYEEISLASLSSSDYSSIQPLIEKLSQKYADKNIALALPSLRADTFSVELANMIERVKKTGLTFAPEAGTQRMREIINKNLDEADFLKAVEGAFSSGWKRIKLYFMIGLPSERQEDIDGIVNLVNKVLEVAKTQVLKRERYRVKITVNISPYVPKPHTPFQWVAQNTIAELQNKQRYLKKMLSRRNIIVKWHDARQSLIEGALARGDRRLAKVIEGAWKLGAKFDAWTEEFKFSAWMQALDAEGLKIDFYTTRERVQAEVFPWDHIDSGIKRSFFLKEYEKVLKMNAGKNG